MALRGITMAALGLTSVASREGAVVGDGEVVGNTYQRYDYRSLEPNHKMKPPTDTDDEKSETLTLPIGTNTPMKIGLAISLGFVVWWAAQLQSDVGTIKQSLTKLDSIQIMQGQLSSLTARVEALERRGSEPMQSLQKQVDKLGEELRVHDATTRGKMTP
jgi:hypothetical protein